MPNHNEEFEILRIWIIHSSADMSDGYELQGHNFRKTKNQSNAVIKILSETFTNPFDSKN